MDDVNQLVSDLQDLVTRLQTAVHASDQSRAGHVVADSAGTARADADADEGQVEYNVRAGESGQSVLFAAYRAAALVIEVDLTLGLDAYRGSVKVADNERSLSSVRREQVYLIDSGRTGADATSQRHRTPESVADWVSERAAELIVGEAWPLIEPRRVADPGHAEAAATAVESFKEFIHRLAIGRPVSETAKELRLPVEVGDLVATLPLPGDHAIEALTRWIRVAGVLVGVVTGNQLLTIACMKSLVKSEATSFLADAFGDAALQQDQQSAVARQQPDVSTDRLSVDRQRDAHPALNMLTGTVAPEEGLNEQRITGPKAESPREPPPEYGGLGRRPNRRGNARAKQAQQAQRDEQQDPPGAAEQGQPSDPWAELPDDARVDIPPTRSETTVSTKRPRVPGDDTPYRPPVATAEQLTGERLRAAKKLAATLRDEQERDLNLPDPQDLRQRPGPAAR